MELDKVPETKTPRLTTADDLLEILRAPSLWMQDETTSTQGGVTMAAPTIPKSSTEVGPYTLQLFVQIWTRKNQERLACDCRICARQKRKRQDGEGNVEEKQVSEAESEREAASEVTSDVLAAALMSFEDLTDDDDAGMKRGLLRRVKELLSTRGGKDEDMERLLGGAKKQKI